MVQQISVFAENTKGAMRRITDAIHEADVNIIALVTNDSAEFGIVRMIVDDSEKAAKALKDAGYQVHCDDVLGVEMDDTPGGLNAVLKAIEDSNTNIDYLYISYDRKRSMPIAIIHTQELPELEECLTYNHFHIYNE